LCQPIADAFVHVQCAYTSLERLAEFGLFWREPPFFARVGLHFRHIVVVTYGGEADRALAEQLRTSAPGSTLTVVDAADESDPTRFQASVPGRVAAALKYLGARTAIVHTDQHYGGEVGAAITRVLREQNITTGFVARGGYHWSWFEARDHGPDSAKATRAAAIEGEICRAADVVIGSTQRMIDDLAYRHGLPTARTRLIPNFVLHADEPVRSANTHRDPTLILSAGRMEVQKRQHLLIRAMSILTRTHPKTRLALYGTGSLEPTLRSLARDLNAPVDFHPRVPHEQLLDQMRRCAAYVQCAAFEGHPKTIIEAMSAGAPTIVTRGAGVDDEINPGVTGYITGDTPEAIAATLAHVLDQPDEARAVGAAAAHDIRPRLSLEAIFPKYIKAWIDALRTSSSSTNAPSAGVRWDQDLLSNPASAAAHFAASMGAFVKRLSPEARACFTAEFAARAEALTPSLPQPQATLVATSNA
jgi:glycosyltransferase involved in cell wall biosynthesis